MKPQILPFAPVLPSAWEAVLANQNTPVKSPEALLAWVELDLDADLRFEKSLLLLSQDGLFWTDGKVFESCEGPAQCAPSTLAPLPFCKGWSREG